VQVKAAGRQVYDIVFFALLVLFGFGYHYQDGLAYYFSFNQIKAQGRQTYFRCSKLPGLRQA
jgi:hypothetical protein